jgi:hypothetical protein
MTGKLTNAAKDSLTLMFYREMSGNSKWKPFCLAIEMKQLGGEWAERQDEKEVTNS